MEAFLNILRGHAAQLDQSWAHPRIGIISSVDPVKFTARVTIQPEGVLSGWLPVASPWVGSGWGIVCPPLPGDQVIIVWQEGDGEQGIIVGRLWSANALPPPTPSGELWLMHSTGSFIKLLNNGSIESNAPTWTHTGNLHVNGDVSDEHGSVATLRAHYNEHVHPPSSVPPSPVD